MKRFCKQMAGVAGLLFILAACSNNSSSYPEEYVGFEKATKNYSFDKNKDTEEFDVKIIAAEKKNEDREVLKSLAVLAENALACLFNILVECQTLIFAVSHNAWTVLVTRKLPALCDLIIIALFAVFISKSGAAPDVVLKCWIKFKY